MELIRYIHLNPLRARLVEDLKALDKYPWTGHSAILGHRKNALIPGPPANESFSAEGGLFFQFHPETEKDNKNPRNPCNPPAPLNRVPFQGVQPGCQEMPLSEKTIEDVLLHFGETKKVARRRYRQFVKNGIDQGKRPEFQGGGLVRSAGGNKAGLLGRKKEEREKGDARILGSGDFVNETLKKAGEDWEAKSCPRPPLEALISTVSEVFDLSSQQLKSRSRKKPILDARSVLARVAVRDHGYKGVEVAEALSLSSSTVSRIVECGENILDNQKDISVKIACMEI
jgi:hypothetical protein